jgi:hypothetical protein
MKRLYAIIALLVLTSGGMASPAHATSDAQFAVTALNCQHSQGPGSVVSASYIKIDGTNTSVGAVQLCRSGSYYWGYMVMYSPVRSRYWGNARIYRYNSGVYDAVWSCNASGGNGYVEPGQTMCWTPRIYSPYTSQTFWASGTTYQGTYPTINYTEAYGQTARLR